MSKHGVRFGAMAMTTTALLGVGVVAATTASAATPATPATLSGVQAKAAAAISTRVDDLNAAIAKVNGAKSLGSDAATLSAYLQNDIAPLQALGQKIAADQTLAEAQADFATIFTNYRVLALVLPAAHLAGDADAITTTTLPALTADAAKAASELTATNQATLQPLITDLNTQISTASSDTSGLANTVLGDAPSAWNANHALLSANRSSISAARHAVSQARSDLRQIRAALKG
jgi:hypothetical protein